MRPVIADILAPVDESQMDMICFLYRDEMYNNNHPKGNVEICETELIIAKNTKGPTGTIKITTSRR